MKHKLSITDAIFIIFFIFFIAFLAGFIGFSYGTGVIAFFNTGNRSLTAQDLQKTSGLIAGNYDGNLPDDSVILGGIEGMVNSLNDDNSYYFTEKEYTTAKNEDAGTRFGIGIRYTYKNQKVTITELYPHSPAEKAGIPANSEILQINKKEIPQVNTRKELPKLFAESDTITLLVRLPDTTQKSFTLKRTQYDIPDIVYKKMNDRIVYLKIYQFSPDFSKKCSEVLKKLRLMNPKKIIIDVRSNPGGETNQAIFLADQFLSQGIIIKEVIKTAKNESVYRATPEAVFSGIPLFVLVNRETASAAEVFTAAILDNKRGTVIGEKTYGKGKIGNFFLLPGGGALHLSIGKWYTPKNNWIEEKGIKPDVQLNDEYINGEDLILQKAISM